MKLRFRMPLCCRSKPFVTIETSKVVSEEVCVCVIILFHTYTSMCVPVRMKTGCLPVTHQARLGLAKVGFNLLVDHSGQLMKEKRQVSRKDVELNPRAACL